MTLPHIPNCVIDGSTTPAVMRCEHCKTTRALNLPVEVDTLVRLSNEFMRDHRLCHASLVQLRDKHEALKSRLDRMKPNAR